MANGPTFFEVLEPRLLLAADWTVMVYLDGDNNLEGAGIDDVNEMEVVGSTAEVNIVVQFDRIGGGDSSNGDWTGTRRALITQDADTNIMGSAFAGIGEVNMGASGNLRDFITWSASNYAADRYMLILWDHGGGTSGVCWDDTSGDHLSVAEVGTALDGAGVHFDLVGLDACLMGMMETAYEIRNDADVMVAAEQTEPWDGWPYDTFLADLVADPGQTAATLADSIVTRYGASYGGAETLSAVDVPAAAALAGQIDAFAQTVVAEDDDWGVIGAARGSADYFTEPAFRDLGTFLAEVAANASNAAILAAAAAAEAAYAPAIVANHSGPGEGATGLSIYLPAQGGGVSSTYSAARFEFAADTGWDEFLQTFTASESGGGTDTDGTIATANAAGSPSTTINANIGLDGGEDVGGIDVDFYAVQVVNGQTVGFDIDAEEDGGSLDSILRLFEEDGSELAFNDDAHDPDSDAYFYDSYIEYTFPKTETVYIAVSGYSNSGYDPLTAGSGSSGSTGSYKLRIRGLGGAAADENGTIGAATRLGTAPAVYAAAIGDEASGALDVDFYALDVESNQDLTITVDSGGSGLDGFMKLFTSAGAFLAQNDDTNGLDPEISYDFSALGAGTYYVAVSGAPNTGYDPFVAESGEAGSTGAYSITVAGSSVDLDFDGTIPRANALGALPETENAAIGDEPAGSLDVDVYALDVTAGQRIGFDIDADELGYDLDAWLRLFDASGNELASSDDATDPDSALSNLDPYIEHTFGSAGTYYIAVSGAANHAYSPFVEASGTSGSTGEYRLRVRDAGVASDTNATLATATPLAAPGSVSAEIGDELADDLDVDLYAVEVTAGQMLTFDIDAAVNGSPLDSILRLFNDAGTELARNDDAPGGAGTHDSLLSYEFTTDGTYTIGVSGYRNLDYDPFTQLSGQAASTGAYDLNVTVAVHGPDLTAAIDGKKLPAFVVPGQKKSGVLKKVPVIVTNSGDRDATGTVKIDLYASEDETIDRAPDTRLASIEVVLKLKAGKSKKFSFSKLAVPDLGAINYYLIADLDVGNRVNESNESNNTAASDNMVEWQEAAVDLAGVIDISNLPPWVQSGGPVNEVLKKISITVTNEGNAKIDTTIIIKLYASADQTLDIETDTELAAMTVPIRLKAGSSKKYKFPSLTVPVLPAGDYHLIAQFDADDVVTESNEANNAAASTGTVEWRA